MKSLLNDPNFGGIHRLNRAQLLDDLLALAAVQIHTYDIAFDLLRYLEKERELGPWQRAVNILNKLGPLLDDEDEKQFKVSLLKVLITITNYCFCT